MTYYLALIGKRCSGKDTFSIYVSEKYKLPSINFSKIIGQIGLELKLIKEEELLNKSKLQYVGNFLRNNYGEKFYTEKLMNNVKNKNYLINGMRHLGELEYLKSRLHDKLVLVGIICDDEIRYERAKSIDIVSSLQDFQKLEDNPAEASIEKLLKKSEYKLTNNNKFDDFYKNIDELFKKINYNKSLTFNK